MPYFKAFFDITTIYLLPIRIPFAQKLELAFFYSRWRRFNS